MNTNVNTSTHAASTAQPCALIMAGGTGGHIFPGLALAHALRECGWRVHWLGAPNGMESRLVPKHNFPFEPVQFAGVRGKGVRKLLRMPLHLLRALVQSWQVVRRVRPTVVIGFGGYISFPGAVVSALLRKPVLLHEQNAVAGMANRVLAPLAHRVFMTFPGAMTGGEWIGNPLRPEFLTQQTPDIRFAQRTGPLKVLVVGGSLGAAVFNHLVPQALALIPQAVRPVVTHQSGEQHLHTLQANYTQAGVHAQLTPFIQNTAQAYAQADVVICRAGASTVAELAVVGAAAVFVPFPAAVDDHQTHNARFLVQQGAGVLLQQNNMTAQSLANLLQKLDRATLLQWALQAKKMQKMNATETLVAACQEFVQ